MRHHFHECNGNEGERQSHKLGGGVSLTNHQSNSENNNEDTQDHKPAAHKR